MATTDDAPARRSSSSLAARFDPRRNNLDVLRLALALLVLVDHGVVLSTGTHRTWGRSAVGDFAVDGFFVLSGFLITRSYVSLNSFGRYVWHRALRILPAFWTCLLLTVFVAAPLAALLTGRPLSTPFTTQPSAWRYLLTNAGLLINQYDIGGLLGANPNPFVFNGSLWTLFFEAGCYAVVAGLGVVGLLTMRRGRWVVTGLAVLVWGLTLAQEAGASVLIGDSTLRLLLAFLVGASAWLLADRVPMRSGLAVLAAAALLVSAVTLDNYRLVGIVPAAYLLLWLGTCLPPTPPLRRDLSYGIYIYHWPVLQLMAAGALLGLPVPVFIAVGAVLTALLALASWRFVEHPALRQKHRGPRWMDGRRTAVPHPRTSTHEGARSASR